MLHRGDVTIARILSLIKCYFQDYGKSAQISDQIFVKYEFDIIYQTIEFNVINNIIQLRFGQILAMDPIPKHK